jgi:uncharacterized protein (DUF736 family)
MTDWPCCFQSVVGTCGRAKLLTTWLGGKRGGWNKRSWIARQYWAKNSNTGGIKTPDFKLYYRAIAIKTVWHRHKNRYKDQWNRVEDPDINPHSYTHLTFDKGAKKHKIEERSSSTSVAGKTGYLPVENKLDPCLSPSISINSKWIKDWRTLIKDLKLAGCWWLIHIILATQEAEIRRIEVWSQPGKIVHEPSLEKNPS